MPLGFISWICSSLKLFKAFRRLFWLSGSYKRLRGRGVCLRMAERPEKRFFWTSPVTLLSKRSYSEQLVIENEFFAQWTQQNSCNKGNLWKLNDDNENDSLHKWIKNKNKCERLINGNVNYSHYWSFLTICMHLSHAESYLLIRRFFRSWFCCTNKLHLAFQLGSVSAGNVTGLCSHLCSCAAGRNRLTFSPELMKSHSQTVESPSSVGVSTAHTHTQPTVLTVFSTLICLAAFTDPTPQLYSLHLPPPFTSVLPLPHPQAHTVATWSPQWWSVPVTQYMSHSRPTVCSQIRDFLPRGRLCILKISEVRTHWDTNRNTLTPAEAAKNIIKNNHKTSYSSNTY